MVYLRTNYRVSGKQLDADAIGGVGKYIEQCLTAGDVSQVPNYFGGLCFFSWTLDRVPTTSGVIPISAYGVMCQTYGPTLTSGVFGAGFRFFPIAALPLSQLHGMGRFVGDQGGLIAGSNAAPTASVYYFAKFPANSYSTSITLLTILKASEGSAPARDTSTNSVAFRLIGFICSTPWS